MQNRDPEQERLKRLRDRQLADRDPLVKQRQLQQYTAQRERRANKPLNLGEMWADIPKVWKGALLGIVAGLIALLVVPIFWTSTVALLCVAGGTLVVVIFGMLVGRALDWRDEVKHLTK
jgi:hypothetical protein